MNYDVTLVTKAIAVPARPISPDIRDPREHLGESVSRSIWLRQGFSTWLHQVADRIAPRPVRAEHDDLFDAISALLSEPGKDVARLESASHRGC